MINYHKKLKKRLAWTPVLLSILILPCLFSQSDDNKALLKDKIAPAVAPPTDELIDFANIKLDADLIYGPSPWALPKKYEGLINSDYRREFFRMTGIEYSGLHWKQFVMVYMNVSPEIYVKNYFEYVRLYYSDDEDGGQTAEHDTNEGWDITEFSDDEEWNDAEFSDDEEWNVAENNDNEEWNDAENNDGEEWNEPEADVNKDDSGFDLFVPGTILLKEHYKNENGQPGAPETITLMIKREKGYDPNAGDWEYSQFDTTGKMLMEGRSRRINIFQNCTECHANIKERDYIFTTYSSWLPVPEKNN